MMEIRNILMWFLVLGGMASSIHAIHCDEPIPICRFMYEDGCPSISEASCNATGGTYLEDGDPSCNNSCAICVNYVGVQERCNVTLVTNENFLKTVLCQPTLVCTRVSDGICVEPLNCSTTNDAYRVHQTIHTWTLTSLIFTALLWF